MRQLAECIAGHARERACTQPMSVFTSGRMPDTWPVPQVVSVGCSDKSQHPLLHRDDDSTSAAPAPLIDPASPEFAHPDLAASGWDGRPVSQQKLSL